MFGTPLMTTGLLGMQATLINKDTFVPGDDDIYVQVGDEKQRLIFGAPLKFDEEEQKHVEEFENFLKDRDLTLPEGFDSREMFRHYQGCNYDVNNAYDSILTNHEFMKKNVPVNMEGLDEFLQSGMVYFYKRDIHYRPVCIINVKKLVKMNIEDEALLRLTFALSFYVIGKYLVSNKS